MSNQISLKLTDDQESFLNKIAVENKLMKNNNEPSESKALKFLLDEFIKSAKDNLDQSDSMSRIERMIEEINITIPHLVYSTLISAQSSIYNLSDDVISQIKDASVKQSSKICGQIQEEKYEHVYISNDNKQMKTIPIEQDKNKWK
jgi:hypothetical protein